MLHPPPGINTDAIAGEITKLVRAYIQSQQLSIELTYPADTATAQAMRNLLAKGAHN